MYIRTHTLLKIIYKYA